MKDARGLHVGLAAIIAVAAAGYFSGIRGTEQGVAELRGDPAPPSASVEARSYADMRERAHGPNAGMYEGAFARLEAADADLYAPVEQSEADREAALERRASRRAYDGAPPTIPHRIEQLGAPDCLSCHERGLRVANLTAPRMSHRRYESCTQCHVVSADPRPLAETPPPPDNTFAGMPSPRRGARAYEGAPPTIPHPTLMRSECASCHGVHGALGIRSTHPYRQSCTQCHAPSAELDQRAPRPLSAWPPPSTGADRP
ncbi:diheme cytochrome C precursor [Sorangium cellulosum So ce56]|uniref:Diheme cytochrome C n=1 Tax=Sorangium cellulosum (strain So ce56) TaxID=448385 RepID=A9FEA0_SORC5|nr:nitrate reductase cytochrome c-type subunit [Sorangium cellulosum]CAN94864.1 diheme cytochrome C precursor [Sorangium cellulosum So ce56]